MSNTTFAASDDELELTAPEIVAIIDTEARARYGLSADEFIDQVRADEFDECGGAADLIGLARLLGADDRHGLGV